MSACTTTSSQQGQGDRAMVVTTLDLFAQTEFPKGAKPWLGDWEFRRDRLEIVDSGLRDHRPDIAVFQNAMRRTGSMSEDDGKILQAGALSRYELSQVLIQNIAESGEDRTLAVGVLKPATVVISSTKRENAYWDLGADGHLGIFEIPNLEEPILVVNVLMPSRRDQVGLWYSFVKDRILEITEAGKGCPARTIVAGYLPVDQDSRKASDFMTSLKLKDTAIGFCQNAARCHTASLNNEIYAVTRASEGAGQMDRVLVHESAQVLSAGLAFTASRDDSRYKESYNLTALRASQRFGWMAKLRFASCGKL